MERPNNKPLSSKTKNVFKLRIIRGISDTIGVAISAFLIIIVIALIGSLFSWLQNDYNTTFSSLASSIYEAIFVGD